MSASPFITAIRRHAAERPRAPALTCGDSRLDWAGFAASVEQAAAAFARHGVSPGDRVAIVAAFDEDGFLKIVGRKKDVVISGGFNVYASDLESVLLAASRRPRGGRDRHPERGVGRDPMGGGGVA